ncbi:hypothetical protein [Moraxella lacunata]|uniref:hypothetical protein n=1 Tax=Moraxella lacunata TaxID=477 RepID=UPI003EDE8456
MIEQSMSYHFKLGLGFVLSIFCIKIMIHKKPYLMINKVLSDYWVTSCSLGAVWASSPATLSAVVSCGASLVATSLATG